MNIPTAQPENLPARPATPLEMLAQAVAQGADPAIVDRLMSAKERWEATEARKAFDQAIAKARSEIGPIFKRAEVRMGTGRPAYRHERLDDIEREVVPALSKYGLSYRFGTRVPDNRPDWIIVTCKVAHKDGHFEENSLGGPHDTSGAKNPLQAIGSAVTYLERYTLKAALGLSATADTDAAEPEEPVSENELAMLRKRIEQVGQSEERVCAFYKISKLDNLPASQFDSALKKLDASAKT